MVSCLYLSGNCCCCSSKRILSESKHMNQCKWCYKLRTAKLPLKSPSRIAPRENLCSRRRTLLCTTPSVVFFFTMTNVLNPVQAEGMDAKEMADEEENGVVGAIKSLFDPNQKTKSGKVLPKAYVKAAREVVKTLKESVVEDPKDVSKFRRTADAAKESIREYLGGWKDQQAVVNEESYVAIEKAIRSLANFYAKAGPFAALSEEVKSSILENLNAAEANL